MTVLVCFRICALNQPVTLLLLQLTMTLIRTTTTNCFNGKQNTTQTVSVAGYSQALHSDFVVKHAFLHCVYSTVRHCLSVWQSSALVNTLYCYDGSVGAYIRWNNQLILVIFYFFYFGSCGRLSWLNCQLSSAR